MKHPEIYGGTNFPFMTGHTLSVGSRWIIMAVLLSPFVAILAGLTALVWWLV